MRTELKYYHKLLRLSTSMLPSLKHKYTGYLVVSQFSGDYLRSKSQSQFLFVIPSPSDPITIFPVRKSQFPFNRSVGSADQAPLPVLICQLSDSNGSIVLFSSFSCTGHQSMVSLHKGCTDWRIKHHNWSGIRLILLSLPRLCLPPPS